MNLSETKKKILEILSVYTLVGVTGLYIGHIIEKRLTGFDDELRALRRQIGAVNTHHDDAQIYDCSLCREEHDANVVPSFTTECNHKFCRAEFKRFVQHERSEATRRGRTVELRCPNCRRPLVSIPQDL